MRFCGISWWPWIFSGSWRRTYTEEKAKVVAVSWGAELLQFLAVLAILHGKEFEAILSPRKQWWLLLSLLYKSFFYASGCLSLLGMQNSNPSPLPHAVRSDTIGPGLLGQITIKKKIVLLFLECWTVRILYHHERRAGLLHLLLSLHGQWEGTGITHC